MTATAEDADPAKSTVVKEESNSGEFLTPVKSEEGAPSSTPFVTGLIKQEEAIVYEPPATELGTDCEAPAPSDLKKETLGGMNQGMMVGEQDEYLEAVGLKDRGMELPNESCGISGMEFETEGEIVKEDCLDVLSVGDEEAKPVSSSDVTESQMEHILDKISADEKVLDTGRDDEDGPDEEEPPVAPASVGSISLESITVEVWSTKDQLAAKESENVDEDDGPPPGRDSTVITEEVEAMTPAPVESILLEIKTDDVQATNDTLPFPCLENDDDDGPPRGWEAVIKDEVEPVPPAYVENIQLETKMAEVRSTEDTLSAPGFENDDDADGPPPGWEAMVIKDERKHASPASVESIQLDTKMKELRSAEDTLSVPGLKNDDDADGPPPGWEAMVTKDEPKHVPPASVESIQLDTKMEEVRSTEDTVSVPGLENDDNADGPPPGWEATLIKDDLKPLPPASIKSIESSQFEIQTEEELPPPGMISEAHTAPRPSLPCEAPSPTTDVGQVVCGSCRSLLSYPKGAKYVQCLCCQTVSLVLEAHQIGQVYCGSCSILLMYRFGSQAVKCSGCKFITQITPDNQRPPLSEQGVTLQSQLAQLRPRASTNLAQ